MYQTKGAGEKHRVCLNQMTDSSRTSPKVHPPSLMHLSQRLHFALNRAYSMGDGRTSSSRPKPKKQATAGEISGNHRHGLNLVRTWTLDRTLTCLRGDHLSDPITSLLHTTTTTTTAADLVHLALFNISSPCYSHPTSFTLMGFTHTPISDVNVFTPLPSTIVEGNSGFPDHHTHRSS
jgi:hypothetical protein